MNDFVLNSNESLAAHERTDADRRKWLLATGLAGGVVSAGIAVPFVASFAPSERARAMGAAVNVDIATLPPGALWIVEWRGKPVWVAHRTPEMLAALAGRDDQLADPDSLRDKLPAACRNVHRSIKPELFVAIGICTHLGCAPNAVPAGSAMSNLPKDWPGGYFCPCHGSTFDGAGRVYKNKPAPTNLEIPPHHYVSNTELVIGEDAKA